MKRRGVVFDEIQRSGGAHRSGKVAGNEVIAVNLSRLPEVRRRNRG